MATVGTSNVDQVNAWLKQVVDGFTWTLTLEAHSLGEDCAHIIADGIAVRSANNEGAQGIWYANEPKYAEWKSAKYGVPNPAPNRRTGQMLSLDSLLGTVTITTDRVTMQYGTGTTPTRSSASSYFDANTDGAVTDRQKAEWNSDKRPFFELDDQISDAVFDFIEETIEDYLELQ